VKREFIRKIIVLGMTTLIVTSLNYTPASAKWTNDSNNNWNWTENGVKATGWKEIDSKWYYFNKDGMMLTGWINYSQNWYSLASDGSMNTGWKNISGKWYYFDSDGKMSVGWINDNGTWYFTDLSGEMVTGTLNIDGVVYNFSDDGQLLNNENSDGKNQSTAPVTESGINNAGNSRVAYVATNSDFLNVRSEAAISSYIIGKLPKGTKINIIDDEKNGFYPLMLNGKEGWVSSDWVSFKTVDSTTTSNTNNTSSNTNNISSNSNSTSSADNSSSVSNISTPPVSNDSNTNTSINSNVGTNTNVSTNTNANTNTSINTSTKDVSLGAIRNTEPSLDNKYYYSDDNIFYKIKLSPPFYSGGKQIKGNCTWYAWGRAWEITGIKPTDAGFIGNAYEWWDANKNSGKYQYGSQPRVGAIAVWNSSLPNAGGDGHVAIVEKIDNGKVYISESTWNGVTFRYKEIYETEYLDGYIYLDKPNH
jgi:uncharacterized protein YgiM (DUF1202 family)